MEVIYIYLEIMKPILLNETYESFGILIFFISAIGVFFAASYFLVIKELKEIHIQKHLLEHYGEEPFPHAAKAFYYFLKGTFILMAIIALLLIIISIGAFFIELFNEYRIT